jgi:hypothetical protein
MAIRQLLGEYFEKSRLRRSLLERGFQVRDGVTEERPAIVQDLSPYLYAIKPQVQRATWLRLGIGSLLAQSSVNN